MRSNLRLNWFYTNIKQAVRRSRRDTHRERENKRKRKRIASGWVNEQGRKKRWYQAQDAESWIFTFENFMLNARQNVRNENIHLRYAKRYRCCLGKEQRRRTEWNRESARVTRLGSFDINIVVYCAEQATMKLVCLSMHQIHISLIDEPNQSECMRRRRQCRSNSVELEIGVCI